ncbi:glucose-methanol-choline oxidoreductase [Schizophyllum amplum]|uniref:Glucose-methanol-choline oxidoreductase n=1 Tax=Schizophyllum amplum TaxID=97359 RepID=A0A550CIL3_9AGAR|nr:glucose-methanol-choline oxidoreductase [Auriculariopsis ampla]
MTSTSYDYIIVGAGTAGLSLAVRLAQSEASVLVLEAGVDTTAVQEIQVPGLFIKNIGHPDRDWAFFSKPQAHANNREVFLPRGKGIGGSSTLNFMQWNRASSWEYDAMESFGMEGWNWKNMLHYFKKSEIVIASNDLQEATMLKLDPSAHGTSGPIIVSPPTQISDVHLPFLKGFEELGFPVNQDSSDGDNLGTWTGLVSIDPAKVTRSSCASAYLTVKTSLSRLEILTGAQVMRIAFAEDSVTGGLAVAEGVEFTRDGTTQMVTASKEVIVCAGAYQTPQILELSGIGDKHLLNEHGIETVVDLPGVGRNLRT